MVSFTPGFSPVLDGNVLIETVSTVFLVAIETVKTVSQQSKSLSTGLKPGVNEKETKSSNPGAALKALCLHDEHLVVNSTQAHQAFVISQFDHFTVVDHCNVIGHPDR